MARKTFSISVSQGQDFDDIGALSPVPAPNQVSNMSEESKKRLLERMKRPVSQQLSAEEIEQQKRLESLIPSDAEQLIAIEQLKPAPDEWNFFGQPEPDQYYLVLSSIYQYGLWHAITVWEQEDGSYMILGGHTRHLAYRELLELTGDEKYKTIPCKVYKHDKISEATARRIIILSNVAQRAQENTTARIRCFAEMTRLEKQEPFYSNDIGKVDIATSVAKIFGVSRSTVFFYRRLEKLIQPLLDAFDQRVVTAKVTETLCDIPQELQQYIYDNEYHLKLTLPMGRALKNAQTTEEVDEIVNAPKKESTRNQYVISTKFKKPNDFDFVPIAIQHDEVAAFKKFLSQSLDLADGLSDKTKEVIMKMIK